MNAEEIEKKALAEIAKANNIKKLEALRTEYLGRRGHLTQLLTEIPELPRKEDKEKAGLLLNRVKKKIENALREKNEALKGAEKIKLKDTVFDPTTPGRETAFGTIHPLTQFRVFVKEAFEYLGFEEVYAPHIESDDYNFGLLNMPQDHPARDLWDTLYIDPTSSRLAGLRGAGQALLRTHTSNIQVREMEKRKPPVKVMSFDRCFRYEALDSRHSHTFTQLDLLYVDRGVSMANLKWLSDYFMKRVFGEGTETRFRPKYYPFVEPGVGIDALCPFCKGKGCKICGKGWLELAGAGMVHPKVLKNGGIDPTKYSGLAWGFGVERILMIRLGIDDIRYFYEGDLRFLKQF
jgi:phenylalanyl-tRNA synthetase alpha chain